LAGLSARAVIQMQLIRCSDGMECHAS
jgi:hypothetical protein